MAGKFKTLTDNFALDISAMFSRAIRRALIGGLVVAVQTTKHDSSNAAAHWLIAAKGKSRPGSRVWGKLRDLRGTSSRPATPPVGKRRSYGANEIATVKFVREREMREVVEKLVAGRSPETIFYFYNAIATGTDYEHNAEIEAAGMAATQEVARQFNNAIQSGQVRKRYR
ncbi:hypothetical protein HOV23_gp009 [Pseudomonas phage Lana]|uniref:Uncharacterized protein n=1 Tax=Pseudomonas phage Lana TaxID=2530172 RepID=A0A481W6G9_9CAUD|nr:hypothetical protein HOV23_gp009 [Pseudomonas phage Lana]QBJ04565.1 hypothetical protein [Pseudomonas phage Lana]